MYGVFNRILRIDLERKMSSVEILDDELYKTYLSGKGMGSYLLSRFNPPQVDPLSPENCLIITPGFASGTTLWGSSRYGVFTKSPLTGIYAESYSGGSAAQGIARTGYDAIIIEKVSKSPIYLEITDEFVKFHDASDIWGKDAYDTERELLTRVGETSAKAIVIGPAGENLVRFATISNDFWRCAGRTGTGAVLGAKKVKGIVFYGKRERQIANIALLRQLNKELLDRWKIHPKAPMRRKYGTTMTVNTINNMGAFPAKYWTLGKSPHVDRINGDALINTAKVRPKACQFCFISCGKLSEVIATGKYQGVKIDGPEYETIGAFGGLCLIDDINAIIYLNDLCDRYGIDTMTAGNLCAFAIEASKRGRINEKLEYGDVEAVTGIIHKMVNRKGYGDTLANGIKFASQAWGLEDMAIHVKGLEPASIDPRILKGMGLSYAVSARGACHLRATFYIADIGKYVNYEDITGTAKLYIDFENSANVFDSVILCKFFKDVMDWDELLTVVEAVMGLKLTREELKEIGANIQNITHEFNQREGLTRKDDYLPKRFYEEPLPEKGDVLQKEMIETLIDKYWELRGWDA